MKDWLRLDSGANAPAYNMALDEALLENAATLGQPVLRFYDWTEPCATFGYSQKIAAIEAATDLRPLIRRCTGGGLVPHDGDWTYSLIFPPDHEWAGLTATESYRRVHELLQTAFAKLGIRATLADCCRRPRPRRMFCGSRIARPIVAKQKNRRRRPTPQPLWAVNPRLRATTGRLGQGRLAGLLKPRRSAA